MNKDDRCIAVCGPSVWINSLSPVLRSRHISTQKTVEDISV